MIRMCAFADEASESLDGQIAALKRNCISLIEVRAIDGVNIAKISEEDAREYARRLSDAGIAAWSIGSPLGKVSIDCDFDEYEKTVRHVCRLANIFGAKRVRMFSFFGAYEAEDKVMEYLGRMVEIAEEYGVKLCHENEKKVFGDTAERIKKIKAAVKGLSFVYDPANFIEVGEDTQRALEEIHSLCDYFHVKDVIRETGELVPAGYGDGDIAGIIERIGDTDRVMTLEPHLAVFKGFAEIDGTQMKNKFRFDSNDESFDAAVSALWTLLERAGYVFNKREGGFERI